MRSTAGRNQDQPPRRALDPPRRPKRSVTAKNRAVSRAPASCTYAHLGLLPQMRWSRRSWRGNGIEIPPIQEGRNDPRRPSSRSRGRSRSPLQC